MKLCSFLLVCGLFGAFSVPASAQKRPVTLADVASARPADLPSLLWAPKSPRFLFTDKKDIVLYDCATQKREVLASLTAIEGKAVKPEPEAKFNWENRRVLGSRPEWSQDERLVLFVLQGDIFLLDVPSRQWKQLTATKENEQDAHLSPDGRQIGYRYANDLFVLDVATGKKRQITKTGSDSIWNGRLDWVYPEELDLGRAWWWSPDSRQIAYLQFDISQEMLHPHVDAAPVQAVLEPERYPKAGTRNADVKLGVVAAKGGKTKWLPPTGSNEFLLARVQWMPDSRTLAVQRYTRVQDQMQLLAVDTAAARQRVLLEETSKTWLNVHDMFTVLGGGKQFLWASEADGYRHLYLHDGEGKLVKQLTKGEWEVTSLEGVDEAKGLVYFSATKDNPMERHLYRLQLADGSLTRLSAPGFSHTISMSATASYYTSTFSSLTQPTSRILATADGQQVAVLRAPDRSAQEQLDLLPVETVNFKANGVLFYGQVIKPRNFDPQRKYPAIVMVYGGPHSQTVRNSWAGANWEQALAHKGFVVWRMDNRGAGGRGHVWEAPLYRRLGKVELEDQVEGVKYLVSQGYVDAKRVGIYGWSYGGFMTLTALLHAPQVFRAGVSGAPVTDWRHYDTIYTERYLGLPQQNADNYKASSPVHFAAKLEGKLMLVHNFQDDNVLFQNTQNMMEQLQKAGKPFELMFYPYKSHGVLPPLRKHLLETTTDFFERHLAN